MTATASTTDAFEASATYPSVQLQLNSSRGYRLLFHHLFWGELAAPLPRDGTISGGFEYVAAASNVVSGCEGILALTDGHEDVFFFYFDQPKVTAATWVLFRTTVAQLQKMNIDLAAAAAAAGEEAKTAAAEQLRTTVAAVAADSGIAVASVADGMCAVLGLVVQGVRGGINAICRVHDCDSLATLPLYLREFAGEVDGAAQWESLLQRQQSAGSLRELAAHSPVVRGVISPQLDALDRFTAKALIHMRLAVQKSLQNGPSSSWFGGAEEESIPADVKGHLVADPVATVVADLTVEKLTTTGASVPEPFSQRRMLRFLLGFGEDHYQAAIRFVEFARWRARPPADVAAAASAATMDDLPGMGKYKQFWQGSFLVERDDSRRSLLIMDRPDVISFAEKHEAAELVAFWEAMLEFKMRRLDEVTLSTKRLCCVTWFVMVGPKFDDDAPRALSLGVLDAIRQLATNPTNALYMHTSRATVLVNCPPSFAGLWDNISGLLAADVATRFTVVGADSWRKTVEGMLGEPQAREAALRELDSLLVSQQA